MGNVRRPQNNMESDLSSCSFFFIFIFYLSSLFSVIFLIIQMSAWIYWLLKHGNFPTFGINEVLCFFIIIYYKFNKLTCFFLLIFSSRFTFSFYRGFFCVFKNVLFELPFN